METMLSDDAVRENIAANVRRLLAARGLSQTDLADRTGDPVMAISRIVRGVNIPRASLLARVAEALDTISDRLMADPPEYAAAAADKKTTPAG